MSGDRIHLAGMRFAGHHGNTAEERELVQPFIVDVSLELDLAPAGRSDDLADTVDYSAIYRRVRELVESTSFHLLEALAELVAATLLRDDARIEAVDVRIRKPRVQLGGPLDAAEVEIHRRG
jgi:dihydroneopterin aldolase